MSPLRGVRRAATTAVVAIASAVVVAVVGPGSAPAAVPSARTGAAGSAPRDAGGCAFIGTDLVCHGSAILPPAGGGGGGPGPGRDPSAPSEEPTFTWSWLGYGSTCVEYTGGDTRVERFLATFTGGIGERPTPTYLFPTSELDRLADLAPGSTPIGDYGYAVAAYPDGTPVMTFIARCVRPGEPRTPPAPPSAVEVWGLARLPLPVVHADPPGTAGFPGITGLETRLWSEPATPVDVDAELRGYRITARAHPVGWVFTTPDGATHATEGPPTAASPTRLRFERRGDYALSLAVRWTGTFAVAAPAWGIALDGRPLGTTSVATRLPYRVAEIRARLVPGR